MYFLFFLCLFYIQKFSQFEDFFVRFMFSLYIACMV